MFGLRQPKTTTLTAIVLALVLLGAATALAQRRGGFGGGRGGRFGQIPIAPNTPYDGRFMFVRVRYGPDYGFASQGLPWSHDYPAGEQHFMKIMNEVSYLNPHTAETNILPLDSPDLSKYPIAYLCEPGGWSMSEQEAEGLRDYLRKGGFVMVDDFRYGHWGNFEAQMLRALPEARFFDLELSHPIFHSFFEIKTLNVPQYYDPPPAIFRAIFEDNDPTKRIMVMINYNTDISEYWEWSDTGLKPIDESNEAYKLGVNQIMYGMTH
jgi:Domain of unknown function (DUF4159)